MTFAVWLGFMSSVAARDIFVNNVDGDDRRSGGSPASHGAASGPVKTITRALQAAAKGDHVILANTGQPYRESVALQCGSHSGYDANSPFVIQGNGAVLDGAQDVPSDRWEHFRGDVFRFRPARLSYQLLFLDGKPALQRPPSDGHQLPNLQPLEWSLFDRYVYFRVQKDSLPHQYKLSHAVLPAGLTLYQVRHVVISDLVIQGFQLDGVNAADGVFDAVLVGLTCRGNGRSGVSVGGASRVRMEACLVGNNGAAQLRVEGWSKTEIVRCNLLDNTAPPVVRESNYAQVEVGN
jgi:hypothetical protein